MKKVVLGLVIPTVFLVGCAKSNVSTETTTVETGISSTTEEKFKEAFEDGVLKTKDFELQYKDSKIIKSPSEKKYGLYMIFDLTNISEHNIVPFDILNTTIVAKQENDTSLVTLQNNYYELDAFGDDTETYNEQVAKSNALANELLPDKTTEVFMAFTLDNLDFPVKVYASFGDQEIECFVVDTPSSAVPETNTTQETTEPSGAQQETGYIDNDTIAQNDYREAIEYGLSEEETAYYLSHKWYGAPSEYDGVAFKDLNDYLSRRDFVAEEPREEEDYIENGLERQRFSDAFEQEHGRKPSSGEIQLHWLEQQGLVDE